MLLRKVLDLRRSIEENRQEMHNLVRIKGMNDPEVITISQLLDDKILIFQKMLSKIQSSSQHEKNYRNHVEHC